jgi:hypothetical protein
MMTEADLSRANSGAVPATLVKLARDFGADYFAAINRADLAGMVRAGKADDFPEIQAAIALLRAHADKIARYEDALAQYADPALWDQAMPGGPLAIHDSGEMARNVLQGRPAFYHRD